MKLIESHTDFFSQNPVQTEALAYRQLKENPLDNDICYLAVSWYDLIKNKKLHEVSHLKAPGGFTVCQHIRYHEILPVLKQMGVKTLFASHADMDDSEIDIVPFPHATNLSLPKTSKDIWYSFVGFDSTTPYFTNYPLRRLFFNQSHPENALVIERSLWHFDRDVYKTAYQSRESQDREKTEYADILSRSRFSICLRGSGVNSIRFWESLEAGAIPVVIADGMRLPDGFDWKSCVLWLPEKDISRLSELLEQITPEREEAMREACIRAFGLFSGNQLTKCIEHYFSDTGKQSASKPGYWTYHSRFKTVEHFENRTSESETLPTKSRTTHLETSFVRDIKNITRILPDRPIWIMECGSGLLCELFRLNGAKSILGHDTHCSPKYFNASEINYVDDFTHTDNKSGGSISICCGLNALSKTDNPPDMIRQAIRLTRTNGLIILRETLGSEKFRQYILNHYIQWLSDVIDQISIVNLQFEHRFDDSQGQANKTPHSFIKSFTWVFRKL